MSKNNPHIFTSESVGEGHPDKVADYISDSILDACLAQDKTSRVACETLVKSNMVIIAGELTTKAVMEALDGLPAIKIHCSVLAEQAIKAAVSDYYRRRGIDPTPIVGEIKDADEAHEHGVSEEDE